MKELVFYKVDNSMDYDRHTFDGLDGNEAYAMLANLPEDEVHFYELTEGYNTRGPSLSDFIEDYNDEELDGGWWCTIIKHDR